MFYSGFSERVYNPLGRGSEGSCYLIFNFFNTGNSVDNLSPLNNSKSNSNNNTT